MSIKAVIAAGNVCLEKRDNIPGAPLWHMGKVALVESERSFKLLQNTIDYLTCKGKLGKAFNDKEKAFMKQLFEALWWGGHYKRYHEAAKLADHYVNGKGKIVFLPSSLYSKSIIVQDTMQAMKNYIAEKATNNKNITFARSSEASFLHSKHVADLKQGKRSVSRQGYLLSDGALLVEQSNLRLKNADHRFHLAVSTTVKSQMFISNWKVESLYDFEPFEKGYITNIPLSKGFSLKLPDGLSHYLTKIGVAQDFKYMASWQEKWGSDK